MFSFYFIRRSVYLIDKGIIPKRLILGMMPVPKRCRLSWCYYLSSRK